MAYWLLCLAPKWEFASSSLCWTPICGLAWGLYKCIALWRAVRPSPTELLMKRQEFLPCSGFLCCRDITLAVESDLKGKGKGIRFRVLYPPKCSHDLPPLAGLYTWKPNPSFPPSISKSVWLCLDFQACL